MWSCIQVCELTYRGIPWQFTGGNVVSKYRALSGPGGSGKDHPQAISEYTRLTLKCSTLKNLMVNQDGIYSIFGQKYHYRNGHFYYQGLLHYGTISLLHYCMHSTRMNFGKCIVNSIYRSMGGFNQSGNSNLQSLS